MKLDIFRQIFEKYSIITFNENPSNGRRIAACGKTNGQTDVKKLMLSFCNFANVRNTNGSVRCCRLLKTVRYCRFWQQYGWGFNTSRIWCCVFGQIFFVWTVWPWNWMHHDLSKRIYSLADIELYRRFSWSVNNHNNEWHLCQVCKILCFVDRASCNDSW
jgi:hypothetical protein